MYPVLRISMHSSKYCKLNHITAMIKILPFSRVDIFILVLAPVQINARYYNELKQ